MSVERAIDPTRQMILCFLSDSEWRSHAEVVAYMRGLTTEYWIRLTLGAIAMGGDDLIDAESRLGKHNRMAMHYRLKRP